MSSLNNICETQSDKIINSGSHNKTDDEIASDPETYEFVNGYEVVTECSPQKREISNNQKNEQKGLIDQYVLGEYIEITQEELEKKFIDIKRLDFSLAENMERTSTTLKSMSEEFNEINDQNKKLQNENNKLKEDYDNLSKEKQSVEQDFISAKDYYESKIKNLELKLQTQSNETNDQKTHKQTEKIIETSQNQLSDQENDIRKLNQRSEDEASKYQSALGDASVRLGDDDQNSVQLKQDILNLQSSLEKYVTDLGSKVDINIKEVNILIKQYDCQKEIKPEALDIPFIKAVLQRKALQQIFEFSKNYRKYKGENLSLLESDIDIRAHELLNLIKKFSETRVGIDELSKAAVVKIRQQIYEILGNRGFSNIISPQHDILTHNFIYYSSQTLNEIMNQYRQINDAEKKSEVEKLAPILIRDVLRIFWFRLMIQEPIPEIKFFESNAKINPDLMTGRWGDDKLDELCVDLCYFPLIGNDLDSNYNVISLAKILSRPIQNQLNAENKNEEKNSSLVTRFLSLLK